MLDGRDKISIRQAMLILLIMAFTPAVRVIPSFTTLKAMQAGWLCGIVGTIPFVFVLIMFGYIYRTYKKRSLMEITVDVLGKYLGYIVIVLFFLWVVLLNGLYLRFYGERLLDSAYPNVDIKTFIIILLILINIVIRSGLSVIARMNEVIIAIIVIMFISLCILMVPEIGIYKLYPLSQNNVIPVLEGSLGVLAIEGYIIIVLVFSDQINNMEKLIKTGLKTVAFMSVTITILLVSTIGTTGCTLASKAPLPFLLAVKEISIYGVLDRLEAFVIATWIISDFVLISIFTYCGLKILSFLFHISEWKQYINIYIIFIYLFSLYISNEVFELQALSDLCFIYVNSFIEVVIPLVIFLTAIIRKKIRLGKNNVS
ncbi:MAG: endospore germination permease [Eubacteriales bacterium]